MSDIVERLRDEPKYREQLNGLSSAATVAWHETCLEAADEIERLRRECDRLGDDGAALINEVCRLRKIEEAAHEFSVSLEATGSASANEVRRARPLIKALNTGGDDAA